MVGGLYNKMDIIERKLKDELNFNKSIVKDFTKKVQDSETMLETYKSKHY